MSVVNDCKIFNEENTIDEKCFVNLLNTEFGNNNNKSNNNNNNNSNNKVTRAPPVWVTDENDESTSYSPIKNLAVKITKSPSQDYKLLQRSPKANLLITTPAGITKISKLIYANDNDDDVKLNIKKQKTIVRSRHTYKTDYNNEINNITPSFSRSILVNSPSAVLTSPKSTSKSLSNSPERLKKESNPVVEEKKSVERNKSTNKITKLIMNTFDDEIILNKTSDESKNELNLIQLEQENINDFRLILNNAKNNTKNSWEPLTTNNTSASNELKLNLENIIPTTGINKFNQHVDAQSIIPGKKTKEYSPLIEKLKETDKMSNDIPLKSYKSSNNDNQKSHDRIETRRYMKEQQKKRAQEHKKDNQKDKINKDIIKERLSKLKMNTRKIVNNNVKKTTKKKEINENTAENNNSPDITVEPPNEKHFKKTIPDKIVTKKSLENKKYAENLTIESGEKNKILHLSPYFKRKFGILRRQEDDSKSCPKQQKLNDPEINAITVGTSPIEVYDDCKIAAYKQKSLNNTLETEKLSNAELTKDTIEKHDTALKAPEGKLNINKSMQHGVTNKNDEIPIESKDELPYWLRPSAVQIYPYNFIMAVRKKLEAITNPVIHLDEKPGTTVNDEFILNITKLLDNTKDKVLQNAKSEKMLHEISNIPSLNKMPNSVVSAIETFQNKAVLEDHNIKSISGCGATTNFSSISLNLPQSNTISDISSLKSDYNMFTSTPVHNLHTNIKNNENTSMELNANNDSDTDDTLRTTNSISSVIFSYENNRHDHQNPQQQTNNEIEKEVPKATVSPLSITNIADMRIKSNFLNDTLSKQEEEVSTSIDEILLIEKQERKTKKYRNEEVQTENIPSGDDTRLTGFHKMLEAFNQSLSHVIEVNQQLYSALKCPPNNGIAAQTTKVKDAVITNLEQTLITTRSIAYTDDFELQVNSQEEFDDLTIEEKQFCDEKLNKTMNSNEIEEELIQTIDSTVSHSNKSNKSDSKSKTADSKKNSNHTDDNEFSETIKSNSNKENNSENSSRKSQNTDLITRNYDNKTNYQQENMEELFIQAEKSLIFNNENGGEKYLNNSINNLSIGSDIFAIFNRNNIKNNNKANNSDIELSSFMSATTYLSETIQSNFSYSNIGMYEKMISTEKTKTEHLTYLMKLREKSIIDRTKGQLAWLELQKIKLKEKSLGNEEIKIIKKKQRALLVRLEKERKAIRREIKLQSDITQTTNTPKKHLLNTSIDDLSTRVVSLKRSLALKLAKPSKTAMKGYEILGGEPVGSSLEKILEEREKELRERRNHVENLIKWHQRLDNEEQQVIEMENLLMGYNVKKLGIKKNQPAITNLGNKNLEANSINTNDDEEKKKLKKKLDKIEKSLKILKNISTTSIDDEDLHGDVSIVSNCNNKSKLNEDYVRTSGERMNKLWMRLTNRNEKKFERKKMYKFNKTDLENFYEEAKKVIFSDFFQMNNSKDTTSNTLNSITNLFTEISDGVNNANIGDGDLMAYEDINNLTSLNLNAYNGESSQRSDGNDYNYYFTSEALSVHTVETAKTNDSSTITNEIVQTTALIKEDISDNNNIESSQSITEVIINDIDFSHGKIINDNNEIIEVISDSNEVKNSNETFTYTTPTISTITDITSPKTALDVVSLTVSKENVTIAALKEDVEKNSSAVSSPIQTDDNLNTTIILNEIKTFELKIKNLEDVEEILFNNIDREYNHQEDNNESTELEKRLINIDDSLKNLNETFEKVPIMDFDGKLLSPDSVLSLYSNKDIIEGLEEEDEVDENEDDTFFDDNDTSEIKSIEINEEDSIDELTPPLQPPVSVTDMSTLDDDDDEDKENQNNNQLSPSTSAQLQNKALQRDYNNKKLLITNRMPDIISEAEVLRRQQQQQQIRTSEQEAIPIEQTGYVFLREIPNKPPPPYVPPAHGSPLTALFPSEDRIAEIIYRRTEELYNLESNKTDTNLSVVTTGISTSNQASSILNENITNIYEKIILDVCYECFNDIDIKSINNATSKHSKTYKNQLKFYNPPDKLKCIQEFILKRVKKLLNINSGASAKSNNSPTSNNKNNLLFNNFNYNNNRRKRDHVDVILVDELFEDEHKWINYDLEEEIVLNNVIDDILKSLLHNTLIDVENVFNAKLQQSQQLP